MVMPALPGAHLVLIHPHFPLASFEAGFNARSSLDDPRQLGPQGLCQLHLGPTCRREVILVAIAGVLIRGIPRGIGLHRPVLREGTTGDHQPLLGPCPFAFETSLDTSCEHLNLYWAFLPISHRQAYPLIGAERLAPGTHRLPGGLGATAAPLIRGRWRLEVPHRRVARHAQHVALAPLAQGVAEPRVAPQFIISCDPAVGHLITPSIEHLQALLVPRVIPHLRRDMALRTPLLILCPVLGKGQAEVEQGMVVARDVPHEDADLAVVALAPVATPLALHAYRMRAAL